MKSYKIKQTFTNLGFATWLSIGAAVLCLPWLRYTQPDLVRPIRVPMAYPVLYLLATLFVVIVPVKLFSKNSDFDKQFIYNFDP